MSADGPAKADEDEDRFLTLRIGGEHIRIDRVKARAVAERMRARPGTGSAGIFTAMAGLPGSEIGPARELDPRGPDEPASNDAA